jgi:exopolyphosphatase / guanosine-5'-triphosphate,3'-diphosphate pyrophosphatase
VKVAIVDLGTNTCRLFLAEVDRGEVRSGARPPARPPAVRTVERLTTVVRLGQGVDRSGRLDEAAMARTRDCLAGYAPRLEAFAPERRLLIATSVLRDALDGRAFLEGVERDFSLAWRVLAGEEEGALAFRGGTAELAGTGPSPLVLVDIGGGSTEFAVSEPGAAPEFVRSLDIGVVRLTERFIACDPPAPAELAELERFTAAAIEEAVPASVRGAARGAVGVAGTYTTLVADKLGLREYRSELVHGHVLSRADIDDAIARFSALTNAERGRLPGIQPGREDVILAGAVIAREALRAFGLAEVRCSEADILEGAALGLAEGTLTAG